MVREVKGNERSIQCIRSADVTYVNSGPVTYMTRENSGGGLHCDIPGVCSNRHSSPSSSVMEEGLGLQADSFERLRSLG